MFTEAINQMRSRVIYLIISTKLLPISANKAWIKESQHELHFLHKEVSIMFYKLLFLFFYSLLLSFNSHALLL